MVAVPAFTPFTTPDLSTVAMRVFEELHVTVEAALLSFSVDWFPSLRERVVLLMLIETAFAVTVSLQEYIFPS